MEKLKMIVKKPRDREANWSAAVKECLRECVSVCLDVVENRANDISMIAKKKTAWKDIREAMLSSGYDRDTCKLKAQWVRMKMSTKKAVANIKRATIATGNSIPIPELSVEENLIEGMIVHELEDDDILIDSNSCLIEISDTGDINTSYHPSVEKKCEKENLLTYNTSPKSAKGMKENKKCFSAIKQLRSLPNTSSKNGIILDRQRQISKEMTNADELSKIQIQQINAQIEHQAQMHKMEEAQAKELHSLKLRQIQRQIDHEEELHVLRINMLSKSPNNL